MSRASTLSPRIALLASSSVSTIAAIGGLLALTPGQALAFNQCGVSSANKVACAPGVYASGISYKPTTALTVTLDQTATTAVSSTIGNISLVDVGSGDALTLNRAFSGTATAGGPAPSIVISNNAAVVVASTTGSVLIDLRDPAADAGVTLTGTRGLYAGTAGAGTTTVLLGSGHITGLADDGVLAVAGGGRLTIDTGSATITGAAYGVYATQTSGVGGTANVTIGAASTVSGATAVFIQAGAGVTAVNAGHLTGTGGAGHAVQLVSASETNFTNSAGGVLTSLGATANAAALSDDDYGGFGGAFVISNSGLITTSQTGHNGYAFADVGTTGGVLTNTASGTIDGRLSSLNGRLTLDNAGVWTTNGASTFGTLASKASNTVNNTGLIQAGATGPASGVSATRFTNLGTLNNSGTVSLANGMAGDTLTTDGGYFGSGSSALALDIASNGSVTTADKLVAGGAITGSTALSVVPLGAPGLTRGVVVATGGAGSSASALTIAPSSVNQGFIHYAVAFNAATGDYALIGSPNAAAFETVKFGEAQTNLWYKSQEAWSAHMNDLRDTQGLADGGASRVGAWAQAFGGESSRQSNRVLSAYGVSQSLQQGYDQDYLGVQMGVDAVTSLGAGAVTLGVTGGYAHAKANFDQTNDELDSDTYNLGVYAGFMAGPLFVNGLVKYDNGVLDVDSRFASYHADMNAHATGATLELGYRAGYRGWFFEPVASISYVRGTLNGFAAQGSTVDFGADDSSRGKLGLRTGTIVVLASGLRLAPYASLNAVQEFKDEGAVTFTNAGQSLVFRNNRPGTYGQGAVGVDLVAANGFTTFVEGGGEFGQMGGGSGRLGLRYHW